jgi:hypothetical protein
MVSHRAITNSSPCWIGRRRHHAVMKSPFLTGLPKRVWIVRFIRLGVSDRTRTCDPQFRKPRRVFLGAKTV